MDLGRFPFRLCIWRLSSRSTYIGHVNGSGSSKSSERIGISFAIDQIDIETMKQFLITSVEIAFSSKCNAIFQGLVDLFVRESLLRVISRTQLNNR